jgi:hypothetical protein
MVEVERANNIISPSFIGMKPMCLHTQTIYGWQSRSPDLCSHQTILSAVVSPSQQPAQSVTEYEAEKLLTELPSYPAMHPPGHSWYTSQYLYAAKRPDYHRNTYLADILKFKAVNGYNMYRCK